MTAKIEILNPAGVPIRRTVGLNNTQVQYSGAAAVKHYFKFSMLGNVRIWCKLLCITSVFYV